MVASKSLNRRLLNYHACAGFAQTSLSTVFSLWFCLVLVFLLLFTGMSGPAYSGPDSFFYPMRSDWTKSDGETNFSVFVFNDLNGSGVYDLGDRAMAGIASGLSQNSTPLSIARTNINGFANYAASTSRTSALLTAPGEFEFEVFVPPGWRVTTDNKVQQREIIAVQGSNSGLGMAEMLHPVGLERYKFIRGTFGLPEKGTLSLMQNGVLVAQAALAPEEEFLWPVAPGDYVLLSGPQRRNIKVGAYPVDIGTFSEDMPSDGESRLIDFENMAPSGLQKAPNGYGGLNWFNLNIIGSATFSDHLGYKNGVSSGYNTLYTSSGLQGDISSPTPFDFNEINLTIAWPQAEGETAIFSFYRGDTLVLQDRIGLSTYGPIAYQPRISGVTRVEISSAHNWQIVMDDLRINSAR